MISEKTVDKSLLSAFIISALIHVFILGPYFLLIKSKFSLPKRMEVTYIMQKVSNDIEVTENIKFNKSDILVKENIVKPGTGDIKENVQKNPPGIISARPKTIPYKSPQNNSVKTEESVSLNKETSVSAKEEITSPKGNFYKNNETAPANTINLNNIKASNVKSTFFSEPGFMNYYESIRAKIRDSLEGDFSAFREEGDVVLSFKVGSHGELKSIVIDDMKSCQNKYIHTLAVDGVKNAAPFGEMPKSFKEKEINFIITISFKLK